MTFNSEIWFYKEKNQMVYSANDVIMHNLTREEMHPLYNVFLAELVPGEEDVFCIHTDTWITLSSEETANNFIRDVGNPDYMFFFGELKTDGT